jgi:hemolysin D
MFDNLRRHLGVVAQSLRDDRERRRAATPRENEDFLPAALEIVEQPPRPLGTLLLWVVVAFIVIAIAWACLGQVDVVASAPGKIEPRGRVKIIQAADLGVVRAIHVSDGEAVVAGQPLLELDPTVSAAEVEQARQALLTAEVDVARAKALAEYAQGRRGRFVAPIGMAPDAVPLQVALVEARIRQHEAAVSGLRHDGSQRISDVAMVAAEIAKLEEQMPLATRQLESLERLEAQGYAPRLRVDEIRERVVGMRQDLAIRREEFRRATAGRLGAGADVGRLQSEFDREAYDALTEAQATRALRAEELKKAEEKARLTILTAPEAGVVQQLQANTVGGVVQAAAPLMILVPRDGDLVLEARVLNRDIGFVREGQAVEVKLEAYPFTRYGIVEGVLEHVARDAVENETEGLVYPARIRLARPWIAIRGSRTRLAPGMAATVEIKTGRRRIIEYLLSPLARRAGEAGRER